MTRPPPEVQVQFLVKLQQLLAEGQFTASYKFALLLALADLSVELGDDSEAPLRLSLDRIAEKFIRSYWVQAAPYIPLGGGGVGQVLQQNTDRQAAIVTLLTEARTRHGEKMGALIESSQSWPAVKDTVGRIIKVMPLWKLQTVRGGALEFLYPNGVLVDDAIELYPGVAFCFRRFHELIQDLVQGAWLRFVRNLPANQAVLGQACS